MPHFAAKSAPAFGKKRLRFLAKVLHLSGKSGSAFCRPWRGGRGGAAAEKGENGEFSGPMGEEFSEDLYLCFRIMATAFSDFDHPRLGRVRLFVDRRARRFVFRYPRREELCVTLPPGVGREELLAVLREREDALLRLRAQAAQRAAVGWDFRVEAPRFSFALQPCDGPAARLQRAGRDGGAAYLYLLPRSCAVEDEGVQRSLRRALLSALRHAAAADFPRRVEALARRHGFRHGQVAARVMYSRWGSCSCGGDISLSVFLLLLPERLADYVVCHELCHTVEMNHGPRFWQLLGRTLGADPRLLRRELAPYGRRFRAFFG